MNSLAGFHRPARITDPFSTFPAETRNIFSAGYCTAFALHNIIGGDFCDSVNAIANSVKRRAGTQPCLDDVLNLLEQDPKILASHSATIERQSTKKFEATLSRALSEKMGSKIFLLIFHNRAAGSHIESVYRGQISNPARILCPHNPSALDGAVESPIAERSAFISKMFARNRSSKIRIEVMNVRASNQPVSLGSEQLNVPLKESCD